MFPYLFINKLSQTKTLQVKLECVFSRLRTVTTVMFESMSLEIHDVKEHVFQRNLISKDSPENISLNLFQENVPTVVVMGAVQYIQGSGIF